MSPKKKAQLLASGVEHPRSSIQPSKTARGVKRSAKPIPSRNPERIAKKKIRQAAKHRLYMRSETRRDVDYRAGGRCEAAVRMDAGCFEVQPPDFLLVISPTGWFCITVRTEKWQRCENTTALQHHHLTYARYGGSETPEDVMKVCRRCHEWLDKDKPSHRR